LINVDYYQRQQGLVHTDALALQIVIIGAGGIGSWTALALTKMGCQKVTVFDGDEIEQANVGSQLYASTDIGQKKVDALSDRLLSLSELPIEVHPKHWDTGAIVADILISAVDSMEVRRRLYETHKGRDMWFVDGRMAGNEINIYAFNLSDQDKCAEYEMTLFTDEEADPIPCSERAVMYNTFVCGGLIASTVARIANGENVKFEVIVDLKNFTMF
jgi:tRNA A37 threonylcarbamoyladenosine dehydratase